VSEPKILDGSGKPVETEGTVWDKPGPTAPPGTPRENVPDWFLPVRAYLENLVSEESIVLDLSYRKAFEIVDGTYRRGAVGIDCFVDETGSGGGSRIQVARAAAPLAVELYRQVIESLGTVRAEEFRKVLQRALEKKVALPRGT